MHQAGRGPASSGPATAAPGAGDQVVEALLQVGQLVELPAGPWRMDEVERAPAPLSTLLVRRGIVAADIHTPGGRRAVELLGPGDMFALALDDEGDVGATISFRVFSDAQVLLLGDGLKVLAERWPAAAARLLHASAEQARRRVLHRTLAQLPRVEERVLGVWTRAA